MSVKCGKVKGKMTAEDLHKSLKSALSLLREYARIHGVIKTCCILLFYVHGACGDLSCQRFAYCTFLCKAYDCGWKQGRKMWPGENEKWAGLGCAARLERLQKHRNEGEPVAINFMP